MRAWIYPTNSILWYERRHVLLESERERVFAHQSPPAAVTTLLSGFSPSNDRATPSAVCDRRTNALEAAYAMSEQRSATGISTGSIPRPIADPPERQPRHRGDDQLTIR